MYTNFYNLREEPFRLTSDPRFFHLAEPHAAALATVVEAVMRRKGFVLMTGPIGTGKTTVVHTALQILTERAANNHPISSAFILNPTLSREEFLEMLLSEFEITCTSTSKPARLAALQRMLLETQRKGGTSLLLVDEAHLLTPELLEEIRLLSNADTYQEKVLQILDAAAAALRSDPSWSQALVDGPRILGLQSYDQNNSTVRLQVRTAPARHEDVSRELRRRIQLEFQRQGIPLSNVQRVELVNASGAYPPETPAPSA